MFNAFKMMLFFSFTVGFVYTLVVTGISQVFFPYQSNGSLIKDRGEIVGSELIGQNFSKDDYFWSRPSAVNYSTIPSGASNLGPTSKQLKQKMDTDKIKFTTPAMLTSSGSGLDPHLPLTSIQEQLSRVVQANNLTKDQVTQLQLFINSSIEPRSFGIMGEERINVLKLNMKIKTL